MLAVHSWRVFRRNCYLSTRTWWVFLSGLVEPLLLFLSVGVVVGNAVHPDVSDAMPTGDHAYLRFVFSGLLAVGVMNGAIYESTLNFFYRYHHLRSYDVVLTSPLTSRSVVIGEAMTAWLRGILYGAIYGVIGCSFALINLPQFAAMLPWLPLGAFGFAGLGIWLASLMRSWNDLELVNLVMLPMVMLACVFFPLSAYPQLIGDAVRWLPLSMLATCMRGVQDGTMDRLAAAGLAAFALVGMACLWRAVAKADRLLLRS
ncbi:ABC transporter permease [Streptomyces sp. NPDC046805]|uniref:ABC transporter permease n=1 Tax=Streptomyces sp. NPDC046805 TaxID=3155134 RepID=UPI0033D1E58E